MRDPQVLALKQRVTLVADAALMDPAAPRSGRVAVTLRDGRTVAHFTKHPPGTRENPLDASAVSDKARGLMAPVIGNARADAVVERVHALDRLASIRDLVTLLR